MKPVAPLMLAAVLAGAAPAAGQSAGACQPLSAGVNTLKGVLHEVRPAGASGSQFALQLERPLCARGAAMTVTGPAAARLNGRMLALALPGGDPRRFLGRRVLVSGTLVPAKPGSGHGAVLQVGSFTPLPQVALGVS